MKLNSLHRWLVGLALLAPAWASAQTPVALQQLESLQQRRAAEKSALDTRETPAPELYPGEVSDTGPQFVVQVRPRRRPHFEAASDTQFFYTDNIFLQESGVLKEEASVLVQTVEAALASPPMELAGGRTALRLGYRHQWFMYGLVGNDTSRALARPFDSLDFNAQTVFIEANHEFGGNWLATVGLDWQRLLSSHDYKQFYSEWAPRWGLTRRFQMPLSAALAIGYAGAYHLTDADVSFPDDANDRLDSIGFVTYTQPVCPGFVIQPFYRFKYSWFPQEQPFFGGHRDDLLHSVGIGFYAILCPNATLRAFVGYDHLESDGRFVADYRKLDAGGGLTLNIRL
jgi:hypothetical protein